MGKDGIMRNRIMESFLSLWRKHRHHEPQQIEDENEDEDDLDKGSD